MKPDHEIELDVKDELQWDPNLDATDIAVSVKKGVVTLAGFVKNYAGKYEAESAAKRVAVVAVGFALVLNIFQEPAASAFSTQNSSALGLS